MKRRFATAVTAGTLGTASVLGIGLAVPAARANPDDSAKTVSQDSGDDQADDDQADDDPAPWGGAGGLGAGVPAGATSPADLVNDGYQVLTSTEAPGTSVGILGPGGTNLQTAAAVLGMDLATLQEEMRSGATLGELARSRDVEQVTLVRALAEEQESRLEQWLQDA